MRPPHPPLVLCVVKHQRALPWHHLHILLHRLEPPWHVVRHISSHPHAQLTRRGARLQRVIRGLCALAQLLLNAVTLGVSVTGFGKQQVIKPLLGKFGHWPYWRSRLVKFKGSKAGDRRNSGADADT